MAVDFRTAIPGLSPASFTMECTALKGLIMRPSSLGGGRIMRRTLSVRLSVRPSRYRYRASRRAT